MDANFNFTSGLEDLPAEPIPARHEDIGLDFGDEGLSEDESDLPANELSIAGTRILPHIPNDASFDPRLAFEVALGFEKPEKIYPRYDLTEDDWLLLAVQPMFKKAVLKSQEEMQKEGTHFRLKAQIQAEAYLTDAHLLIKSAITPPTVKADMIKWMAKMADLEPRKTEEQQGNQFNLQINFSGL